MSEDNQSNSVDVVGEWITMSDGVEVYTRKWKVKYTILIKYIIEHLTQLTLFLSLRSFVY